MSNITAATKVERISSVVITAYDGTLNIAEDTYNRGGTTVTVTIKDLRASLLDDLLRFAQPQEDECPVREVTLQAVIDEMQTRRDKLNETWGNNKGEPRPVTTSFSISPEDAKVVNAVLNGTDLGYEARDTVRKALSVDSGW